MAYATPAELGTLAQEGQNEDTALLLLTLASNEVDRRVRRPLAEAKESQVLAGTGKRTIPVVAPGWPLTVESVVVGDDTLTEGEDFRVRADGTLWRLGGKVWDEEIEVTYTTGFKEDSSWMLTAKRITLEVAARAAGNPQWLDSITVEGASPSFMTREGQTALPQLTLTATQRRDLDPIRWRRWWA